MADTESPEPPRPPRVLVTGASGYLGSHVVRALLLDVAEPEGGSGGEEPRYRVRGTVRDLDNEGKVAPVRDLVPGVGDRLELVAADLTKPDTWDSVVSGCEYVIHVASPFPAVLDGPRSEEEVVRPAVDGTTAVLAACQRAKCVRRVVLTSSTYAVHDTTTEGDKELYSEEDWIDAEKAHGYARSKVMAEKAAWDFVDKLEGEEKFELAVINPSLIVGPVLINTTSTSMAIVKKLMEGSMPMVPKINFPLVDVRNVAQAHVKALTLPEAAGKRHILSSHNCWIKDMASVLHKEFKSQGYKVPTSNAPYFLMKIAAIFDKQIKQFLPSIGKETHYDTKRMKEVLGIEPIDYKESMIEMAYSMIEHGQLKKSKKFKGPNAEGAEQNDKGQENGEEKENKEGTQNGDATPKPEGEGDKVEENGDASEKPEAAVQNGDAEDKKADVEAKEEDATTVENVAESNVNVEKTTVAAEAKEPVASDKPVENGSSSAPVAEVTANGAGDSNE